MRRFFNPESFGRPLTMHERMGAAAHMRSAFPVDPQRIIRERELTPTEITREQYGNLVEQTKQAARRGDREGFYRALAAVDRIKPLSYFVRKDAERMLQKALKRRGVRRNPYERRYGKRRHRLPPRDKRGRFKKRRRSR